jgi:TolA-binding protein
LYKLGVMLGQLGQVPDACVTLNEVLVRFPGNPAALEAQTARAGLACP